MRLWFNRGPRVERDPYGVAVFNDAVHVVSVEDGVDALRVTMHLSVPIAGRPITDALADAVARLPDDDHRCVIAANDDVMMVERFTVRDGNDLRGALESEALRSPRFGDDAVRIALCAGAPLQETDVGEARTVAFASVPRLDELVATYTGAGFEVVAVDYEGCAWYRAVPRCEALIVERPTDMLVVGFQESANRLKAIPVQASDMMFLTKIDAALAELAHDYDLTVTNVAVLPNATHEQARLAGDGRGLLSRLSDEKRLKGISLSVVSIGGVDAPPWALAYGLATYAVGERIDGEVAYAF